MKSRSFILPFLVVAAAPIGAAQPNVLWITCEDTSADVRAASEGREPPPTVHDPAKVRLPPIHPDTPEFRREWARHFDYVARMDAMAGEVLRELEADGLAQDTISMTIQR